MEIEQQQAYYCDNELVKLSSALSGELAHKGVSGKAWKLWPG